LVVLAALRPARLGCVRDSPPPLIPISAGRVATLVGRPDDACAVRSKHSGLSSSTPSLLRGSFSCIAWSSLTIHRNGAQSISHCWAETTC